MSAHARSLGDRYDDGGWQHALCRHARRALHWVRAYRQASRSHRCRAHPENDRADWKTPREVPKITADNGTEFHSYKEIEEATDVTFYFATPHHAWERGTNENTNGLIRQYCPKDRDLTTVTEREIENPWINLTTVRENRWAIGHPTKSSSIPGLR